MNPMMSIFSIGTRIGLVAVFLMLKVLWWLTVQTVMLCALLVRLLVQHFQEKEAATVVIPSTSTAVMPRVNDPERFRSGADPSGEWGAAFFDREAADFAARGESWTPPPAFDSEAEAMEAEKNQTLRDWPSNDETEWRQAG
jgi:hypothetical protein